MLEYAADLLEDFITLYETMNTYQVQIHGMEEGVTLLQSEAGVADLSQADLACCELCISRKDQQQVEQEKDTAVQ